MKLFLARISSQSLIAAACLVSALAVPPRARAASPAALRPNVLLIVSDDQGYADVGFQGCKDIPTPQLDRLASDGLRCTSGYVSHMYCSPTRAGLMTGRYQARFGHEHNPHFDPSDHREGLPTSERILPEFLQKAGYATGWIGKWHLGAAAEFRPEHRGFQETFGFIGGGHHFINWPVKPLAEYNVPIERNGKAVEVKEHLTLAFGHEGAAFVRRHQAAPWFLYLAFHAPHSPNEPTPERLAKFKYIKNPLRRSYAAQVSLMDDAVGEVMAALRESKQDRRTLVFFFSDNGGQTLNGADNGPLHGKKGDVYEGGIHVPYVVSWPGRLPSGKDYPRAVSSLDVFATALACAGVPMPTDRPYDSVNLLPYLSGENAAAPHERLFWRRNERVQASMREGNKKLIRDGTRPEELYDLATDLGETHDLAGAGDNAKTIARMDGQFDEWFRHMAKHLAFPGDNGPEREWPARADAPSLAHRVGMQPDASDDTNPMRQRGPATSDDTNPMRQRGPDLSPMRQRGPDLSPTRQRGPDRNPTRQRDTNTSIPRPTPAQLAWQQAEFGVLFHFDPRIYNGDRGYQSLAGACRTPLADPDAYAAKFRPDKLDTDQWAATAKSMGARFAILVVKHETGFCIWQSDANRFSLKHVPWRDGRGDILRDFVASCRKADIRPGIFTEARWDLRLGVQDFKVSARSPVTQAQYNRLVEEEVRELCTRYGDLFEIWFDGGVRAPSAGGPDVLPIVAKYQPAMLFYHSDQRRDVRWGGSEDGTVGYPCWATVDLDRIKTGTYLPNYLTHGDPAGRDWCPAMSDAPLRSAAGHHDWLWQPGAEAGIAPLARLQKMYYGSVGRNSTLIVGLTPDRDGLIPAGDAARCREFGDWLAATFGGKPRAETSGKKSELTLQLTPGDQLPITHIILQEQISGGERVRGYVVEGEENGVWTPIASGTCIGQKRIEQIAPCAARSYRLRITKAVGEPEIRSFSVR